MTLFQVADASPIPTMIYNFAGVTGGLDLDSDTVFELSSHPNIVGTKLSCGNIGKLHRLTSRLTPKEFAIFTGRSDTFIHSLNAGSAGVIAATVNIAPKAHVDLYNAWMRGEREKAMETQAIFGHADWAVSKIGGIGGIKGIVAQKFGYGQPYVRSPLKVVDESKLRDSNEHYQTLLELINLEAS
jgi:dihydrodipicolinate synthase/N-acetylneuraminate lyase